MAGHQREGGWPGCCRHRYWPLWLEWPLLFPRPVGCRGKIGPRSHETKKNLMCSIQFKSINVRHCENTVLWCLFAAFISLGFICTWKNHSTFPLLAATQENNTSSFCFPSTYRDYRGTTHPRFYLTKTLILKLLWGHCVTNRSSHCGTESSVLGLLHFLRTDGPPEHGLKAQGRTKGR